MIHIFIINNFAGNKNVSQEIRAHLAERKDIRYFVFNTVQAGFERDIVKKIHKYFPDEKLRFYCCGGSGTMRNMLDGFENFDNIEFAFYPCGLTNDFLKAFPGGVEAFANLDKLIDGKAISIDYIRTNHGVAINTFSLGIDANVAENMEEFRIYDMLGKQIPYYMSLIGAIFFASVRGYELEIDGVRTSNKYSELIVGNGCVLGGLLHFAEEANVTDGLASYMVVNKRRGFAAVKVMMELMKKNFTKMSKYAKWGSCKVFEIRSLDEKPIMATLDGEMVVGGNYWKVEIINKGLKFVIPTDMKEII